MTAMTETPRPLPDEIPPDLDSPQMRKLPRRKSARPSWWKNPDLWWNRNPHLPWCENASDALFENWDQLRSGGRRNRG